MVCCVLPDIKSAEMNVSDLELFKKSKIIEIGSVNKKLQLREVGGFGKFPGIPKIFVPGFQPSSRVSVSKRAKSFKIRKKYEKFFVK